MKAPQDLLANLLDMDVGSAPFSDIANTIDMASEIIPLLQKNGPPSHRTGSVGSMNSSEAHAEEFAIDVVQRLFAISSSALPFAAVADAIDIAEALAAQQALKGDDSSESASSRRGQTISRSPGTSARLQDQSAELVSKLIGVGSAPFTAIAEAIDREAQKHEPKSSGSSVIVSVSATSEAMLQDQSQKMVARLVEVGSAPFQAVAQAIDAAADQPLDLISRLIPTGSAPFAAVAEKVLTAGAQSVPASAVGGASLTGSVAASVDPDIDMMLLEQQATELVCRLVAVGPSPFSSVADTISASQGPSQARSKSELSFVAPGRSASKLPSAALGRSASKLSSQAAMSVASSSLAADDLSKKFAGAMVALDSRQQQSEDLVRRLAAVGPEPFAAVAGAIRAATDVLRDYESDLQQTASRQIPSSSVFAALAQVPAGSPAADAVHRLHAEAKQLAIQLSTTGTAAAFTDIADTIENSIAGRAAGTLVADAIDITSELPSRPQSAMWQSVASAPGSEAGAFVENVMGRLSPKGSMETLSEADISISASDVGDLEVACATMKKVADQARWAQDPRMSNPTTSIAEQEAAIDLLMKAEWAANQSSVADVSRPASEVADSQAAFIVARWASQALAFSEDSHSVYEHSLAQSEGMAEDLVRSSVRGVISADSAPVSSIHSARSEAPVSLVSSVGAKSVSMPTSEADSFMANVTARTVLLAAAGMALARSENGSGRTADIEVDMDVTYSIERSEMISQELVDSFLSTGLPAGMAFVRPPKGSPSSASEANLSVLSEEVESDAARQVMHNLMLSQAIGGSTEPSVAQSAAICVSSGGAFVKPPKGSPSTASEANLSVFSEEAESDAARQVMHNLLLSQAIGGSRDPSLAQSDVSGVSSGGALAMDTISRIVGDGASDWLSLESAVMSCASSEIVDEPLAHQTVQDALVAAQGSRAHSEVSAGVASSAGAALANETGIDVASLERALQRPSPEEMERIARQVVDTAPPDRPIHTPTARHLVHETVSQIFDFSLQEQIAQQIAEEPPEKVVQNVVARLPSKQLSLAQLSMVELDGLNMGVVSGGTGAAIGAAIGHGVQAATVPSGQPSTAQASQHQQAAWAHPSAQPYLSPRPTAKPEDEPSIVASSMPGGYLIPDAIDISEVARAEERKSLAAESIVTEAASVVKDSLDCIRDAALFDDNNTVVDSEASATHAAAPPSRAASLISDQPESQNAAHQRASAVQTADYVATVISDASMRHVVGTVLHNIFALHLQQSIEERPVSAGRSSVGVASNESVDEGVNHTVGNLIIESLSRSEASSGLIDSDLSESAEGDVAAEALDGIMAGNAEGSLAGTDRTYERSSATQHSDVLGETLDSILHAGEAPSSGAASARSAISAVTSENSYNSVKSEASAAQDLAKDHLSQIMADVDNQGGTALADAIDINQVVHEAEQDTQREKDEAAKEGARVNAMEDAAALQSEEDEKVKAKKGIEEAARLKASEDARQVEEAARLQALESAKEVGEAEKEAARLKASEDARQVAARLKALEDSKRMDADAQRKEAEAAKEAARLQGEEDKRKAEEAEAKAARTKANEVTKKVAREQAAEEKRLAEEAQRLADAAERKAQRLEALDAANRKEAQAKVAAAQKAEEDAKRQAEEAAARRKAVEEQRQAEADEKKADAAAKKAARLKSLEEANRQEVEANAAQETDLAQEQVDRLQEQIVNAGSDSARDILESLLRAFMISAAGTFRNLAEVEDSYPRVENTPPAAQTPPCMTGGSSGSGSAVGYGRGSGSLALTCAPPLALEKGPQMAACRELPMADSTIPLYQAVPRNEDIGYDAAGVARKGSAPDSVSADGGALQETLFPAAAKQGGEVTPTGDLTPVSSTAGNWCSPPEMAQSAPGFLAGPRTPPIVPPLNLYPYPRSDGFVNYHAPSTGSRSYRSDSSNASDAFRANLNEPLLPMSPGGTCEATSKFGRGFGGFGAEHDQTVPTFVPQPWGGAPSSSSGRGSGHGSEAETRPLRQQAEWREPLAETEPPKSKWGVAQPSDRQELVEDLPVFVPSSARSSGIGGPQKVSPFGKKQTDDYESAADGYGALPDISRPLQNEIIIDYPAKPEKDSKEATPIASPVPTQPEKPEAVKSSSARSTDWNGRFRETQQDGHPDFAEAEMYLDQLARIVLAPDTPPGEQQRGWSWGGPPKGAAASSVADSASAFDVAPRLRSRGNSLAESAAPAMLKANEESSGVPAAAAGTWRMPPAPPSVAASVAQSACSRDFADRDAVPAFVATGVAAEVQAQQEPSTLPTSSSDYGDAAYSVSLTARSAGGGPSAAQGEWIMPMSSRSEASMGGYSQHSEATSLRIDGGRQDAVVGDETLVRDLTPPEPAGMPFVRPLAHAMSEASSAWSLPMDRPTEERAQRDMAARNASAQAREERGIPSLPLASITGSSAAFLSTKPTPESPHSDAWSSARVGEPVVPVGVAASSTSSGWMPPRSKWGNASPGATSIASESGIEAGFGAALSLLKNALSRKADSMDTFRSGASSVRSSEAAPWKRHRIRRGETHAYSQKQGRPASEEAPQSSPAPAAVQTPPRQLPREAPKQPAPLPAGWQEAVDPSSGNTYFYNRETGATSWDRPQDVPEDRRSRGSGTPTRQQYATREVQEARSEAANAVDSLFGDNDEIEVLELFFDAQYDAVDLDLFRVGVLRGLGNVGVQDEDLNLMVVNLRPGSIVAQISGPAHVIRAAQELNLQSVSVCGYPARLSKDELLSHRRKGQNQNQSMEDSSSSWPAYMTRPSQQDLDGMVKRLTSPPAGNLLSGVRDDLREECARDILDNMIVTLCEPLQQHTERSAYSGYTDSIASGRSKPHEASPTYQHAGGSRDAMLEGATKRVLESKRSIGAKSALGRASEQEVRQFINHALDTWCSSRNRVDLGSSGGVPRLVHIPRPGEAEMDQLTERVLTGRSARTAASSEVRESVALGWLMDMQEPLIDAAEQAPPLVRPSDESINRMIERHTGNQGGDQDAMLQEMLEEIARAEAECGTGGASSSGDGRNFGGTFGAPPPRPSPEQLDHMAARVTQQRGMPQSQAVSVRAMLADLTETLFGDDTRTPPYQVDGMERPNTAELRRMAATVSQRCGAENAQLARTMLKTMSERIFGPSGRAQSANSSRSRRSESRIYCEDLPRPSPRSLEVITQRVLARAGGREHEDVIRELLMQLTGALFGLSDAARPANHHSLFCSARSNNTNSDDVGNELNQEVRGLINELCVTVFADSPPPTERSL